MSGSVCVHCGAPVRRKPAGALVHAATGSAWGTFPAGHQAAVRIRRSGTALGVTSPPKCLTCGGYKELNPGTHRWEIVHRLPCPEAA